MSHEFQIQNKWKNMAIEKLLPEDLFTWGDYGFIISIANDNFMFWIFVDYDVTLKYIM